MYLRTIQRRNKDGSVVRYVQLARNVRHPKSGHAVAQVLHSFGHEDQLDRDGLARLVGSLSRYLDLEQPAGPTGVDDDGGGLTFVSSKSLGGCWALDGLWRRLGLDELVRSAARPAVPPGRGRAGAVRVGREPGAGPVLEAGRGPLGRA